MLIYTPSTVYTQARAIELAAQLNAHPDDDWVYIVENNPDPDGPKTAIILIYDENDEFVAKM